MTSTAASLKRIAEYGRPVRFRIDERKRTIYSVDIETRRIVADFPCRRGVDPHAVLPKIIGLLLDSGCEIHGVDGEDTDTALTLPEGVEV